MDKYLVTLTNDDFQIRRCISDYFSPQMKFEDEVDISEPGVTLEILKTLLMKMRGDMVTLEILQNLVTKMKREGDVNGNVVDRAEIFDEYIVDLRSDEVTLPTQEMRNRIANAVLGNDAMGEDPTVKELEKRIAEMLGKEAALLVPSGTMANLISVLVHCDSRGSELVIGDTAHTFLLEQGGLAQFAGVLSNALKTQPDGTFSIEEVKRSFRPDGDHFTKSSLICIENTHMASGGRALPQDWIDELTQVASDHQVPVHMDGARLFNASIATGTPASRIVRDVSSVTLCLAKGLGAPVGALLVGDSKFIKKAKRTRQALGGGMCQSGILAAAGLYALDNLIPGLENDHSHAKQIAAAVAALHNPVISVDLDEIDTNIIFLKIKDGYVDEVFKRFNEVSEKEKQELGCSIRVRGLRLFGSRIRLVTHHDLSSDQISKAIQKICYVASGNR